ncbi:hypothetical protein SAMD00019534_061240 [Acytostelium subglobosum LB1]|uniref:hypothetical protein n=1 Tax=Acytostelium subglobosum LB1 TaxID=1410327 RepID=UPI000644D419|nr:hypothetical protein SAMD00019534_061240 [Acytostelium subglobosum LB1]GAM22949.1 hypothetical protein SAMD00019534_061240 [Acytostelium subglobosum LB1]|eukprot:XP_012754176.1 hypothetical protein SAMD00019534_061240 [Acytostelium subglobosum LB1]
MRYTPVTRALLLCALIMVATSVASAQDPCDSASDLDIQFNNATCDSTIVFYAYDYGWDNLTISPPVTSQRYYLNYYWFTATEAGQHTIFATIGNCTRNRTLTITIPKITITQPVCYGNNMTLTVTGFENRNALFRIDSGPQTAYNNTFVYSNVFQANTVHRLRVYPPSMSSCSVRFVYDITKSLTPQVVVTQPTCGLPNGRLVVTNYQQFSSLVLELQGTNRTSEASNGIFDNVQVATGNQVPYTIYATAAQCTSVIIYSGYIYPSTPSVTVSSQSIAGCNSSYALQTLTVNGLSSPGPITIDSTFNVTAGVQTPFTQGSHAINFNIGCEGNSAYDMTNYYIPVTHTLGQSPQPTCSAGSAVTITYPRDFSTLSASQGSIDSNRQLPVTLGTGISLTSTCDDNPYIFRYDSINPLVQITYDDPTCLGNFTVTIQNYQSFESIMISNPTKTVVATEGVMGGLYVATNWVLSTVLKGCTGLTKNQSVVISEVSSFQNQYITWDWVDVVYPSVCGANISGTLFPVYKGIRSTVGTPVNFNNSNYNFNVPATFPTCPPRSIRYSIPASPQNANITVLSQAPCVSSFGLIQINFTSPVSYYYFNNSYTSMKPSGSTFLVPVGTTKIMVYYQGSQCTQPFTVTINAIDTTTAITYSITPQLSSDCQTASANVTLHNFQNFYTANFNGYGFLSNGVSTVPSTQSGTLYFNHSICGVGQINNIPVPTDTNRTITITPVETSGCRSMVNSAPNSAKIVVTQGGQPIVIDGVTDLGENNNAGYDRYTQLIIGMPQGNRLFEISSGNCLWHESYVQKFDTSPVFRVDVIQFPTVGAYDGVAKVVLLKPNFYTGYSETSHGYFLPDHMTIVGWTISPEDYPDIFSVHIYDFYDCPYEYSFNLTALMPLNKPRFTITPPTQCGSRVLTFKFDTASMQAFEILMSGRYAPDSNGVAYLSLDSDQYINYRSRNNYHLPNDDNFLYLSLDNLPSISPLNVNVAYNVVNESCTYSRDGQVVITNADTATYLYHLISTETGFNSDTLISGTTITFRFLSAGIHTLTVFSNSNTYCTKTISIVVGSNEPQLIVAAPNICNYKLNSTTLSLSIAPTGYTATYKVNGVDANTVTTVKEGDFLVDAVVTGAGSCSRRLSVLATVRSDYMQAEVVSVQCGMFSLYMKQFDDLLQVALLDSSDNVVVSLGPDQFYDNDITFPGLATGMYSAMMVERTGCSITSDRISVTACATPPPSTTTTTGIPTTNSTTIGTTTGLNSSSRIYIPSLFIIAMIVISLFL